MKRICLVGVDNYLMLNPTDRNQSVNGEAVQQVLLAKAFQELGCDVSTIVVAPGNRINERINGIKVLSAFNRREGIPVVRFLHPRATGVFKALRKADADIYFESPAGVFTGFTAAYCRAKQRKFIFRIASDVDCKPGEQLIKYWRDRKIYEFGLRHADVRAVQSKHQAQLLKRHYGLDSTMVNMVLEEPKEKLDGERDIDVLWISNVKGVKRPDRLLALAEKLPGTNFTMIGGVVQEERDLYKVIERSATDLPNVNFLGAVPYQEVNQYVARAKVFLNTSDIEGFPNTFLQAWARKVPVVSYFDPDGIIKNRGLGRRPENESEMRKALRELLDNESERSRIGEEAHAFAITEYSAVAAAKRYLELCGQ